MEPVFRNFLEQFWRFEQISVISSRISRFFAKFAPGFAEAMFLLACLGFRQEATKQQTHALEFGCNLFACRVKEIPWLANASKESMYNT